MSERNGPFPLTVDAWRHPIAYRCEICAALLGSELDLAKHAEWHATINPNADLDAAVEKMRAVDIDSQLLDPAVFKEPK